MYRLKTPGMHKEVELAFKSTGTNIRDPKIY